MSLVLLTGAWSISLHIMGAKSDAWNKQWTVFDPQSFTGYLRLTLVFVWDGALWEGFDFCFSGDFAGIAKIFCLAGGLAAGERD